MTLADDMTFLRMSKEKLERQRAKNGWGGGEHFPDAVGLEEWMITVVNVLDRMCELKAKE